MSTSTDRLRNIGVIAHIDAGKTTTTERILFHTGRIRRMGTVDAGNTVTDWMDQERERGITIVAAAISAEWRGHRINLIDTPGHIDFTAEVQRSLRVLDGAIVVIDAAHGVEPQSETVWRQADRFEVPRLCFVNKMDRPGADLDRACDSLRQRLGAALAVLQLPIGAEGAFAGAIDLLGMRALHGGGDDGTAEPVPEALLEAARAARARLIEAIADTDDAILADWLDGREPPPEALRAALRRATLAGRLVPVLCGAALRDLGIPALLDAVVDYLPAPDELGAVEGTDPRTGALGQREPDDTAPLAALVFKRVNDPYSGHLAYVRVYSGVIRPGAVALVARSGERERVGKPVRMYANHREELDAVRAGDIAALPGLNKALTGDTLCDPAQPLLLEAIAFPEPVIRATVEARAAAEQEAMVAALRQLADEDPTLWTRLDEETGQVLVAGMGELHLEVLLERLRREFGVRARMGRPRVSYKETIARPVAAVEGRFVRQSGGHGQYGHVVLALAPGERGSGLRFESAIAGGAVPREFVPAVERGIREAAQNGPLGGYAVTDLLVRLSGGSSHAVDSSEIAFRAAAAQALAEGLRRGEPVLLEPVGRIEVTVPAEYLGAVLGQLAARRAEIEGSEPRAGGVEAVRGLIPLAETFGYVTELRSATQGRGSFTLEPDHYAPLDAALTRMVLGR